MSCRHTKKMYNPKHDAYYCVECKEWLEKNCQSERCEYCKGRPEKYVEEKELN